MENTIKKISSLLEKISEESLKELEEALTEVVPAELNKVELKTGWAKGNEEEKSNHLNLIFAID